MADQNSKKPPSIPSWQQSWQSSTKEQSPASTDQQTPNQHAPTTATISELLEDELIRDASREQKIEFLQKNGVPVKEIENVLGAEHEQGQEQTTTPSTSSDDTTELRTIHDTTQTPLLPPETTPPPSTPAEQQEPSPEPTQQKPAAPPPSTTQQPKRDIPPVITYPEFLLQPQKPPPLVTFERLANAAYILAGISALTWASSKYLVQPMLESLTEARHSLAETAKADLETLNSKLESSVSHVPYIPSLSQRRPSPHQDEEDLASITSDPTELFHRDIATQTSPHPSRENSVVSNPYNDYIEHSTSTSAKDATTSQSTRLRSLHGTLSSLLSSQTTHFSADRLATSLSDFQSTLNKLESSHNPFSVDYLNPSASIYTGYSGPGALTTDANKSGSGGADKTAKSKTGDNSEATKFKNEIRALKGAFLSSRNFPTARPAQPFTLPSR